MRANSKSLRTVVTLLGVAFSLIAGIYVGLRAYLIPGAFPHYSADSRWFAFYGGMILAALGLTWFYRGRLLLALTVTLALVFIGTTILRAGLVKESLYYIWLIALMFAVGDFLLERITKGAPNSKADRAVLGLPLGAGSMMVLGMLLGAVGAYSRAVLVVLMLVLSLVAIPRWVRGAFRCVKATWSKTRDRLRSADLRAFAQALFLFLLFCVGPFLWSSAPAIRWDALSYHVSVPSIYIGNGGMVEVPESVQSYFVHYAEMLFTLGLLFAGQPLPGWLHFTMGLASALSAGILGAKVVNKRVGILSALLVISLPIINYEIGTAYIDGFIMLFVISMIYAGLLWWERKTEGYLVISGICAGMAIGIKLNALPFAAAFLLIAMVLIFTRTRSAKAVIKPLLLFSLPGVLLWSPWLLREFLWTGNPIYPYFDWLFGVGGAASGSAVTWGSGVGSPSARSPTIIWNMVVNSSTYYHEAPGGAILALPWLALPWGYLWQGFSGRESRLRIGAISVYTFTALIMFLTISDHLRYLMPLYPMMGILAAANLDIFLKLGQTRLAKTALAVSFSVLGLLLLLAAQAAIIIRMPGLAERYPYPLAFGMETREQFLDRTLPFYTAFQYLDQQAGRPKVLALGVDFRLYTRALIDDPLFDSENIVKENRDPAGLASALNEGGYQYVLLYPVEMRTRPQFYSSSALTPGFFQTYTQLVFTNNKVFLFRFIPTGCSVTEGENLLQNGGFERIIQNEPDSWRPVQSRVLSTEGPDPASAHSMLLEGAKSPSGTASLSQLAEVNGGAVYSLGVWAKASGDAASAVLAIHWNGAGGKVIATVQQQYTISTQWENLWLFTTAPPDAVSADIVLATAQGSSLWFDDASLTEWPILAHP